MELKNVEIFAVGTHTDMSGRTAEFTESDLCRIVSTYNWKKHEAPVVIGHPKTDAPAYGWVKRLWVDGGRLFADLHQVAAEFVELLKAGRYKKRSISLGPDGRLRHVGFLGAVPPAVQGLRDVQFGDGNDAQTFEYAEGMDMTLEQAMAKIKELEGELAKLKAEGDFAQKLEDAENALKTEKEARERAEGAAKDLDAKFAAFRAEVEGAKRVGRFEKLVAEGKALPGEKSQVMAFAEGLAASDKTLEFAAADGKKETVGMEEAYWRGLEAREAKPLIREFATHDRAGTGSAGKADRVDLTGKV